MIGLLEGRAEQNQSIKSMLVARKLDEPESIGWRGGLPTRPVPRAWRRVAAGADNAAVQPGVAIAAGAAPRSIAAAIAHPVAAARRFKTA